MQLLTHDGRGTEVPRDDGPEAETRADLENSLPSQRKVLGTSGATHELAEGDG